MRDVEDTDCPEDLPSVSMKLRFEAISIEAKKASEDIATLICKRLSGKSLSNHVLTVAAIVADLLKGAAFQPVLPCFREMSPKSFTGSGQIGFRPFKAVLNDLLSKDYVCIDPGWCDPRTMRGRVTRIYPTAKLLTELDRAGINPGNRQDHFADLSGKPLVSEPIQVRAASSRKGREKLRGNRLPVDYSDKRVQAFAAEVAAINEYLAQQSYEGMEFEGLFRCFNKGDDPSFDFNMGGRLYAPGGGYQAAEKDTRAFRINGEDTVEVDIRASHPTILHHLMGVTLPGSGDPYRIAGLDRYPVKLFVAATLGNGKVPRTWSSEACKKHSKLFHQGKLEPHLTENLRNDYNYKAIRDAVLCHMPLLKDIETCGHDWADLQFLESKVLIDSILTLIDSEIPALPLHDALIVTDSHKNVVELVLKESFNKIIGIYPKIEVK